MGASNVSDFAAWLAKREAALGITTKPQAPQAADVTVTTTPAAQPPRDETLLDRWGNQIIGGAAGVGSSGQYRILAARDGRTLRVCGEAASEKHLLLWEYDEGERRCVCKLCWPAEEMRR